MRYTSTRDQRVSKTGQQAIKQGISEEGGLFVLPHLTDYVKIMKRLLRMFSRPCCLILTLLR